MSEAPVTQGAGPDAKTTILAPAIEVDDAPPTFGQQLRTAALVPLRLLAAMFLPDKHVPREVEGKKYGGPVIAMIVVGLAAAYVVGSRLDVTRTVIMQQMGDFGGPGGPGGPGGGPGGPGGMQQQQLPTEREFRDEVAKVKAIEQVKLGLKAGIWSPVLALMLQGVVLFLLTRYVGGTPTMGRCFTAAAYAALPSNVLLPLIVMVAALRSPTVPLEQAGMLVAPPMQAVFMLWGLVILVFGLAAAAHISRLRAFLTFIIGVPLFGGALFVLFKACT